MGTFSWELSVNVQQEENDDYEFNARYDYQREAYGDLGDDPVMLRLEAEDQFRADCIDEQDRIEARGGPAFVKPYDPFEFPF